MKNPHSKMPEPIGVLPCRFPSSHRGPCSYNGFFTSDDGVRVCMDVAWTSPKQMAEKKRDAKERKKLLGTV